MAYTNSPLVVYTKISPHKTLGRNHIIDTISIHCMAGDLTIETCGNVFQNAEASSNYGVGSDGRIGMYVEEKDRSWCTSSSSNDNRAITIEVANDGGAPDWHVSDKAMESLIKLCADICKRNNIKKLLWQGDKSLIGQVDKQNMTVHRWFANKACPGNYLYNKHGFIAEQVNKILGATTETPAETKPSSKPTTPSEVNKKTNEQIAKEVIAGKWGNGSDRTNRLTEAGYDASAIQSIVNQMYNGTYKPSISETKPAPQPTTPTPKPTPQPTPNKKSDEEIAKEVIAGKWGNGSDRTKKLTEAGYNASTIQSIVNQMYNGTYKPSSFTTPSTPTKKTNEEIAKEVIAGKWGNGDERKRRLTDAGYDASAIQKLVNKML